VNNAFKDLVVWGNLTTDTNDKLWWHSANTFSYEITEDDLQLARERVEGAAL
jgi:hypothetical protein